MMSDLYQVEFVSLPIHYPSIKMLKVSYNSIYGPVLLDELQVILLF